MNILKLMLFISTILAAPLTLFGCDQMAEQPENGINRVKPWSAKYYQVRKEIEGLSRVGIHIPKGEYPIATQDLKQVRAKAGVMRSRIIADTTIR